MKIKLLRIYEYAFDVGYDEYSSSVSIPISAGISDWEELDSDEFYTLKCAVSEHNGDKNKEYSLCIIEQHDIPAKVIIAEELEKLKKENARRKQKEVEARKLLEKRKLERLQKNREKEEKKLREKAKLLGIKLEE